MMWCGGHGYQLPCPQCAENLNRAQKLAAAGFKRRPSGKSAGGLIREEPESTAPDDPTKAMRPDQTTKGLP